MTEQSNIAPDDGVEGHTYRWNADAEATEGDDVEGHRLSGSGLDPLDPK